MTADSTGPWIDVLPAGCGAGKGTRMRVRYATRVGDGLKVAFVEIEEDGHTTSLVPPVGARKIIAALQQCLAQIESAA